MATWQEGIAAIVAAQDPHDTRKRHRFPQLSAAPILVMGSPGGGKSAIWSRLTGRPVEEAMSRHLEVAVSSRRAGSHGNLAVTAIPGQISGERFNDLDHFFGKETTIAGVVFVATYGFDHIWPEETDVLASDLSPFDISQLSDRNMERELDAFREMCARIRQKYTTVTDKSFGPRWLLVLANKVDLYWDDIDSARDYYTPGCGSEFDKEAQRLLRQLGTLSNFTYEVLPVTVVARDYVFSSNRGVLRVNTQLRPGNAGASLDVPLSSMERLCGF